MKHTIVSREEWLEARKALLEKEKQFTRLRDELSQQRQALPWVKVDKHYKFETENGSASLQDLFAGKSQLVVYHFMLGPDWEQGCPSCSFWADNFNGIDVHLRQRDINLVTVSRAPLEKLLQYKKRMGWDFQWVSSFENDFNFDYQVSFKSDEIKSGQANYNYGSQEAGLSELPGISVFVRDDDQIFHSYSCYARGLDMLNGAYHFIDLVPKGRDEADLPYPMAWVQRHDEYDSP